MKVFRYLIILALVPLTTPEVSPAQNNFTAPPLSIIWVRTNPPVNGRCEFTVLNQFNYTTGQYWGCLPLDNPSANGFNVGGWKPIAAPEVVGYGVALPTFCTVGRVFYLTSAMAGANVYGCTALNTWTIETGGVAGGSVTSVSAGCGLTGGPITVSGTLSETIPVAAHNGSYAILTGDCGKALTSNVAGTYTLPQAGSTGFAAGWHGYVQNVGGSGNVTVTTTTSTFYGNGGSGASGVLVPGSGVELVSDGTNWLVLAYTTGPSGGGSGCAAIGPPGTVQASDGAGNCIAAEVGLSIHAGSGNDNNVLGNGAMTSNASGRFNNALGSNALHLNSGGSFNTAIGSDVMAGNVSGNDNVAIGESVLATNTTGGDNIGLGQTALNSNDVGGFNTALGFRALYSNTSGSSNIAIGSHASESNTTGLLNIAIGDGTLRDIDANGDPSIGQENIAIGNQAMQASTAGEINIAIGESAGFRNNGNSNIAIGQAAGENFTGELNIALGVQALEQTTSGSDNVAIGAGALTFNDAGSTNVAVGFQAGHLDLGTGSVFLGSNAGANETGSGKLYIDNTNTAAPLIQGDFVARTVFFNARAGATPHTPASSAEACTAGQTATDANFFYACVSSGVWKRAALSAF